MAPGSARLLSLPSAALAAGHSLAGVDFLEGLSPWRVIPRVQAKAEGKAVALTSRTDGHSEKAPAVEIPEKSVSGSRYGFEGSGANVIVNRTKMQALLGINGAFIEARMEEVEWIGQSLNNRKPNTGYRVRLNFGGPVSIEIDRSAVDALIGEGGLISVDGERIAMDAHVAGNAASLAINHTTIRPARVLARGGNGEIHLLADREMGLIGKAMPASRTAVAAPVSQLPVRAGTLMSSQP